MNQYGGQPYGGQPYPPSTVQQSYPPNSVQHYPPPPPPLANIQQQYIPPPPPHPPSNNVHQPYTPTSIQPQHPPINEKPSFVTASKPDAGRLPATFQFGLFDCFSPFDICCLTCWCPCITAGKTHALESGEKGSNGLNITCLAYCALEFLGLHGLFHCMHRGNMQRKYGMENNTLKTCLVSCCCGCCALVQEQKEAIVRNTGMDPTTNQPYKGYQPVPGMNYA